jgi:hypothetical protein
MFDSKSNPKPSYPMGRLVQLKHPIFATALASDFCQVTADCSNLQSEISPVKLTYLHPIRDLSICPQ